MEIFMFLVLYTVGVGILFIPDRLAAMLFITEQIRINKELMEELE